ncbi:uncharacterized protein LOC116692912 [Etheostoma spectabile]|uniref:uncharacterized protein LOC116692912 n=1 Tax=Etheostoma spectabile TaxID=54343 RepID=UPI0013AFE6C5|nr:uncharacterized protein LOC116692912 [Etheostoma spectabile]
MAIKKSSWTLPPEAQKKMATTKMSPSPTTYLKSPGENYNRTNQTQKEGLKDKGKPSYKRKWEDFNSAGIRRPDNLGPQRKRRRVVLKRVRADGEIVMIAMPKKRNRRRNRRCHLKPVQGAEEWRHPECSGHKGPGEKTWRGGSKKAKHDVRSCFDKRGNTGPKNPSTPVNRPRPFPKKERYGPPGRRNPQSMRHQSRRQWETPGPMCRAPGQGRAQKVPWPKRSWARGRHKDLCVIVTF